MKITVVGSGYVGFSIAVLLSQKNEVICYDISKDKIRMINKKKSPFKDQMIEKYLDNKNLNLKATLDKNIAYLESNLIIIATPTNYDENLDFFDTSSVDQVIHDISLLNPKSTIVIKSTIPIGYTNKIKKMYPNLEIFFSPEFLREGRALEDNLNPSRIVVGSDSREAKKFIKLLKESAIKKEIPTLMTNSSEAEAIKLFSNTYLAMRVSFFNELDTFAELNQLDSKNIIDGISLDPRIGAHYNNPSFGYGGYCLPKDTKQILANYKNIPQNLISAIVESNKTRKKHLANMILSRNAKIIGIYRLNMKKKSDNFRDSSIQEILKEIASSGSKLLIYEPLILENTFNGVDVVKDLELFLNKCDLIISNRYDKELAKFKNKVYTRDIYLRD